MITLSSERGFEQIDSWQQVLDLPGFTSDLNPDQNRLREIIGRYQFKDPVACGLSNCRQPHGRGYIVTTKSGQVTNIGNVCGQKHFGVDFDVFSKGYTRRLTDYQNRETIASFSFRLDEYADDISNIRSQQRGANWVYKTSRALVEKGRGCPDVLVAELVKMVRARDEEIRVARLSSEAEVKMLEGAAGKPLPRPHYTEESKGSLAGFSALYGESDLKKILVGEIEPNLEKLADLDVDSATSRDLGFWAKWCQELDGKLEWVRAVVKAGRALLTQQNLSQLYVVVPDQRDLVLFKKWLEKEIGK